MALESYSCRDSTDCARLVGWGSECLLEEGICSNPFAQGCLRTLLGEEHASQRVCNSDDPGHVHGKLCRTPEIPYPEVRLFAQNWESSVFSSWVLQILLSEILGIPSTVEIGVPESNQTSMYARTPAIQFGNTLHKEALERAHNLSGDCSLANRRPNNYQPCAHVMLEVWEANLEWWLDSIHEGILEQPRPMGILGLESWFVTKFSAINDTTLTSYLGLQGEENRRKMAETFLTPTTWKDYCDQVSSNNCTEPNEVAQRAPMDESEFDRMFVDGLYTGHFRKTDEHDCDLNPRNCTGHVADYPCGCK